MIVALQYLSVQYFTRNVRNEEPTTISKIFWFIFAGSTALFLIVVAVWGGVGPAVRLTTRFAAAVAFSVFDFLIIVAMVVTQIFVFRNNVGGYSETSPVTNV